MAFCINCGKELAAGAKFCFECGTPVDGNSNNQRKTVFEGEIHKCPSCGEVLESFVAKCPSCGYELRGVRASNSIREFSLKLADVKNESQRISLIQSFPIPNNKEDILEFLILAYTNFDAKDKIVGNGLKKDISNAWLAKVEQSYQKAKLLFCQDADFAKIQDVYDKTHEKEKEVSLELKKNKIVKTILRTVGLWGGLLVLVIGFFIDICSNHRANTSVIHLGGGAIMIVGAFLTGIKTSKLIDVGVGLLCGLISILIGMLLDGALGGNGSIMVLGGGATMIISFVQFFRSLANK